ncbi:histidine kinase [Paludifilum halophilum]|uniref:Histidine kinase n=2 Tax=Paludifilum halophilum TaxID=1642702 RepID=A0A235B7D0_9BACL|nr:histidine kinase [Paludifilum halophilum]
MMTAWEVVKANQLTKELLDGLFKGEIGAVRIPHFLSPQLCSKALEGIKRYGVDYYEGVYPKIGKIGITQFEHRFSEDAKREYFRKAEKANQARESIFRDSGDPVGMVIDAVGEAWGSPAGIAREEESNHSYFAGLVRVMNRALLHTDWAGGLDGRDPDWTIGKIYAQLTWNIYLQTSSSGGATVVYQRPWRKSDQTYYKRKDSYGYDERVVENADAVRIVPERGEWIAFNPQYYHEVEEADGDTERITISSFIGLSPSKKLIFWS